MNISLTPTLESFVKERVQEGRYSSASEVIREGLRLLIDQEANKAEQLTALRAKLLAESPLIGRERPELEEGRALFPLATLSFLLTVASPTARS